MSFARFPFNQKYNSFFSFYDYLCVLYWVFVLSIFSIRILNSFLVEFVINFIGLSVVSLSLSLDFLNIVHGINIALISINFSSVWYYRYKYLHLSFSFSFVVVFFCSWHWRIAIIFYRTEKICKFFDWFTWKSISRNILNRQIDWAIYLNIDGNLKLWSNKWRTIE